MKLLIIHDLKNPEVMTVVDFNYPNWRESRWDCLNGSIDAIAVVNNDKFKVFYVDDLKSPQTYFEAKRVGE